MLDASLCRRALLIAVVPWALSACSGDDDSGTKEGPGTAADAATDSGENGDGDGDGDGDNEGSENEGGTDPLPPIPKDKVRPIVFVHGFAGSAQQFTSQAQRYVMNGFPADHFRAYEHDGAGTAGTDFVAGLDAVVDEVRATLKADKVFLIGHSRGTAVSTMYLSDAGRAAKVEKYVSLDGAGCGASIPVPCAAPAQTTNTRGTQTHPLPGQKHVEVATSKESFAVQWEFFFGEKPKIIDIVKQKAPVVISGRAVNFPANTGRDGVTMEFWEVAGDTGKRVGDKPKAKFVLKADGNWGPITVDPTKHYEAVLLSPDTPNQHHFYYQPFLRSSEFIRMLSGPADSASRMNTNTSDHHAAIVMMRMREWTPEDKLEVSTKSKSGDKDPVNAVIPEITNNPISIFLHDDAATPGESSLKLLPWFPTQAFQTGVDVFMPANETPDGTIKFVNTQRGFPDKPQTINAPNWASSKHTITIGFNDYPQD